MNSRTLRHTVSTFFILSALLSTFLAPVCTRVAATQKREHLTPEEIEQIRDAQELDKRTAVFVKAAERRLLMVTDPAAAARQFDKDSEKWGALKGTRAQLLSDLSRILDEAETNIEDTAARDPKSSLPQKSLRHLAEAAARFIPQLTPLRDAAEDANQRESIEELIAAMQEITEAAKNHPVVDEGGKADGSKEKSGKKKKTE